MDELIQLTAGIVMIWVPCLLLVVYVWRLGTPRAGWVGTRFRWAVVTVVPVAALLSFIAASELWLVGGSAAALAAAIGSLGIFIAGLAWGIIPRRA